MKTTYYNKATKYNTKYNQSKRVLTKYCKALAKYTGYGALALLSYIVLVGLAV